MNSMLPPVLPLTDIRDADLVKKLANATSIARPFVERQVLAEQQRRDALARMPRDTRRRAVTRHTLEEKGGADRDSIRHVHSVLAICSLPYQRQDISVREWERKQGKMSLKVSAGELMSPQTGEWVKQPLPYGSRARLLMLHTCSEAIRQKSATIEIQDTLSGFIKSMGFSVTGGKTGTLTSFKQQVNALAACSMRIGVWDGDRAKTINTNPFSSIDVWFPASPDQKMLWPDKVTFSQDFYNTLKQHALPVNVHAVRVFAGSSRKLDLLFWLGYRMHSLSKTTTIRWDSLKEQFGTGYDRDRNFRRDFAQDIADLKEVFPKLPVTLSVTGFHVSPGAPEILALPTKFRK